MSKNKKPEPAEPTLPVGVIDQSSGGAHVALAAHIEHRTREEAYALFLAEGGGELEELLNVGRLTSEAYSGQMRAMKDGSRSWGPDISPYEDRMTRSLQMKIMREKREWIEDCRQRIMEQRAILENRAAEQIANQQAMQQTGNQQPETTTTEKPVPTETPEVQLLPGSKPEPTANLAGSELAIETTPTVEVQVAESNTASP